MTHKKQAQNIGEYKPIFSSKRIILLLWPFFICALVFLSTIFAVRNSGSVEHYYSKGIYPFIAKGFSLFSSLIPFSLWDIFWILTILLIISGLGLVIFRKMKFGRYILRIAQLLAILYSLFYILWGYNYFRPRIETRIGWEKSKTDEMIFRSILDSLITKTNFNYIAMFSPDYSDIDKLIEESYRKNSPELGIDYPNGKRRPKTMLLSSFFIKSGVTGYFGPFFNEIHVNHYLLPVDYPFVLAHEKAHQFGITSEAEANLFSFIICITSEDQRLRYSGYQFLLLYFINDATHLKDYKDYLNKIDSSVRKDLRFRQDYYQGKLNKNLSKMQTAANNTYLKVNHIEKGVKNYNQVVSLVVIWYNNSKLRKDSN